MACSRHCPCGDGRRGRRTGREEETQLPRPKDGGLRGRRGAEFDVRKLDCPRYLEKRSSASHARGNPGHPRIGPPKKLGFGRAQDVFKRVIVHAIQPYDTSSEVQGMERPIQTLVHTEFFREDPRRLRLQGHEPWPDIDKALPLESCCEPEINIGEEVLDMGPQPSLPIPQRGDRPAEANRMECALH